eukprot:8203161-Lingulodinium_polyedra.AAC.3
MRGEVCIPRRLPASKDARGRSRNHLPARTSALSAWLRKARPGILHKHRWLHPPYRRPLTTIVGRVVSHRLCLRQAPRWKSRVAEEPPQRRLLPGHSVYAKANASQDDKDDLQNWRATPQAEFCPIASHTDTRRVTCRRRPGSASAVIHRRHS